MGSRGSLSRRAARRRGLSHGWFPGLLAAATIALLVFANVALISLSIAGVPVRGILAVAILGLLGLVAPELLVRSVTRHAGIIVLALALAALGVFVSVVNGVAPAVIGRMLLEVHVQAMVALLLATMLAELAGPRAAVLSFCAGIAISAVVALVQFAGIDAGWALREAFGNLQGHELGEDSSFANRRPMGLSYSPIHLATQACLAFAAFAALRLWRGRERQDVRGIDGWILAALAVLVAVSFMSQTRSPILGAVVFLGIYLLWRGSAFHSLLVIAAAAFALLGAPVIIEMMQGADSRVFRIGDNSSSGRYTLITYGLMLLRENPLGYGFGFVSQEHWAQFWPELYTMPSAGEIREAELHNYALNMMTTYGIGLMLALPLVARLLWAGRAWAIVFVPYIVHIVFHNTGPFWNDTLFWFVIGAIAAMAPATRTASRAGRGVPSSVRSGSRSAPRAMRPRPRTPA